MTRIIAIVVVIFAAVLAYMYTSAGDVEIGEVPSASQPTGETDLDSAAVPGEEAEVTNPAQEVLVEEDGVEGDAAAVVVDPTTEDAGLVDEAQAIEGTEVPDANVTADTSETIPAEEGPADEEPDTGVGAVSTEEETDGAGIEGIIAEESEQEGLAGDLSTESAIVATEPVVEGVDASQTPENLDTSVENAPEAVGTGDGNDAEAAVAEAADGQGVIEEIEQAVEAAPVEEGAITEGAVAPAEDIVEEPAIGPAITDPAATIEAAPAEDLATEAAPATETAPVEEISNEAVAADPGPALRTNAAAVDSTAAAPADVDALLDAETVDVPAVTAAIEASDLEASVKTQLTEALTTAQDSPALLPDVLERIRAALSGE